MSDELRPCPFCPDGGELFINGGVGCRWVECSSCGCEGPAYETEAEAIEAWNTRAERTCNMETDGKYFRTEVLTWFCSECGSPIYNDMRPSFCLYCGAKVV